MISLTLFYFFKMILTISRLTAILYTTLESACQFLKKRKTPAGFFIGIALNLVIVLEGIDNLSLPNHERDLSFHTVSCSLIFLRYNFLVFSVEVLQVLLTLYVIYTIAKDIVLVLFSIASI